MLDISREGGHPPTAPKAGHHQWTEATNGIPKPRIQDHREAQISNLVDRFYAKVRLDPNHFQRWLSLFAETATEVFLRRSRKVITNRPPAYRRPSSVK